MPKMLGEEISKPAKDEMRELIDQVKPKSLRDSLLNVWAKL
jgi:hypothetical protein